MNKQWMLAVFMAMVLIACGPSDEPAQTDTQLVATAPVTRSDLQQTLVFSGVSRAAERAELAFQSSGIVRLRPVRLGDAVALGDVLAALENPDLEPGIRAAQAALARTQAERSQSQRNVTRLEALYASNAVGEQALEEEQTRLAALDEQIRQAQAELKSSKDRGDDAILSAPFAGLVGQVNVEVGEFVQAGEVVIILGGVEFMEVVVELPTAIWKDISVGQSAPVEVLGLDQQFNGEVYDRGTLADPDTGLFPVVVRYQSEPQTQAGQRVAVTFVRTRSEQLQVPLAAIVDPVGGAPSVYRVNTLQGENKVESVAVEVTGFAGEQVAIKADLEPGDMVITAGHMSLVSGQRVQVQQLPSLAAISETEQQ